MKPIGTNTKLKPDGVRVFIGEGSQEVSERLVKLVIGLENATVAGETNRSRDLVRLIRQTDPDVVILDLHIQERGIQLVSLLRREMPHLGIIVLSDIPDDLTKRICINHGADLFLDKSRDIERLLRALASWNYHHTSSGVAS